MNMGMMTQMFSIQTGPVIYKAEMIAGKLQKAI
jgi:hypothetical protein